MFVQVIFLMSFFILIHSFEMSTGRKTINPHLFKEHEAKVCRQRNSALRYSKVMKESMCMNPRETLVQLVPHDTDYKYTPSAVVVKRCAGMCSRHLTCIPTETKELVIDVRRHKVGESTIACGEVTVEEHVRCKCGCETMKDHCNEHQVYMENDCTCLCMNMDEKQVCEKENKLWDQKECKCTCKEEQHCSTGYTWVPQFCKCMKVMENEVL